MGRVLLLQKHQWSFALKSLNSQRFLKNFHKFCCKKEKENNIPIYLIKKTKQNVPARTVSWLHDPACQALPPLRQLWPSAYYDDADGDDDDDDGDDGDDGDTPA